MNAINRPIPTETAFLRHFGMELKIAYLTLVSERRMTMIPSKNSANKAICHVQRPPRTTVYARYALRPIPAERAKGRFAHIAMRAVPIKDAIQVARRTAVLSIPAAERMLGFTARM